MNGGQIGERKGEGWCETIEEEKRGRRVFRYNRSRCGPCNLASLLPRTPRGLIDGANISSSNYPNHLPNLSSLPLFVECWETLYRFLAISLSISWINKFNKGWSKFILNSILSRRKWWSYVKGMEYENQ